VTNKKNKPSFLQARKYWSRSPIERPHSSKKGQSGYNRQALKQQLKKGDDL